MQHDLKTWPLYFTAVLDGTKAFELRRDDREYAVGDVLLLREWDPAGGEYTGRAVRREVSYLLRDAAHFGLMPGFVVLGWRAGAEERDPWTATSTAVEAWATAIFAEAVASTSPSGALLLARALQEFPESRHFGLRAFPGQTFRVSRAFSFYSDTFGVQLYTARLVAGQWLAFAKASLEELRREIVP